MPARTIDLAFNVAHAIRIFPPDYVRSILGGPASWLAATCPPTELQLAAPAQWSKGLPELAHILIPALPWRPPGAAFPFEDLLFRPSLPFHYPAGSRHRAGERWFFLNGICTDRSVAEINAGYLYRLFGRPLTVLHNYTRGFLPDLAACAVGKEWDRVTESAAVAFPRVYAALKQRRCRRVVLLAHSQGTILSAVILHLFHMLHLSSYAQWAGQADIPPERAVALRLSERWGFRRAVAAGAGAAKENGSESSAFEWPGHGRCRPERVTFEELRKLELYCFANCASEMLPVQARDGSGAAAPWVESYGNEKDIVARLGVLANETGTGSAHIGGDRYLRPGAWGHLLNAHYLYPMITARNGGDALGGLRAFPGNRLGAPRLFEYLDGGSPSPL